MPYTLITRKWAPIALEYAKFLNRNGIETISVITEKTLDGYIMSVFADENDYLKLSFENEHFNLEEAHINELLNAIDELSLALFQSIDNECDDDDFDEYEDEYYDEFEEVDDDGIEPRGENYF